ncbi:hypothetical protein CY0110_16207 [Crocosphaera chwakensis CCY0110]|uniref:Uncharacterized protein n=1 Tax=Crocosphaera chwakensis CCY0110 TaxID=391612 RepID=A3IHS3_9CHRO|nr:hypothetical protein CY0110_16207 [Crocosphaera chwakensis CCY0110]
MFSLFSCFLETLNILLISSRKSNI